MFVQPQIRPVIAARKARPRLDAAKNRSGAFARSGAWMTVDESLRVDVRPRFAANRLTRTTTKPAFSFSSLHCDENHGKGNSIEVEPERAR